MGTIKAFPDSNKKIIKGQPFSVDVQITSEPDLSTKITVSAPESELSGVTLLNTLPAKFSLGVYSQTLIFLADKTSSEYKIKFVSDTKDKISLPVTYQATDNPEMKPDTCGLFGSSTYLYDPTPVSFTGAKPNNNPFIVASTNPMTIQGKPISNYEIPLRTSARLRIFTYDMAEEFKPYYSDDNPYYYYLIPKKSEEAVNLKIYVTEDVSMFVDLETIFNDEAYNQKQVIFMTTYPVNISSKFDLPIIEETFSTEILTRPDQTDYFHLEVPTYEGAKDGDFIIGFVTDDKRDLYKKELCFGYIDSNNEVKGYYLFPASYTDLYDGDNHISYVALNQDGTPSGSKPNYINYNSGGNYGPNTNENRVLVKPRVYNHLGFYIGIHQAITSHEIGSTGLDVRLPHDPNDSTHTIAVGDVITMNVYISHCIDTHTPNRNLPISVTSDPIVSDDLKNGYFSIKLTRDQLIGYEASSDTDYGTITIEYSRLDQSQKSQLFNRSFNTVDAHYETE
jgi:hypothetical protein